MYGKCFLSGEFGIVERHHIFGGALRSKSERYGLVVELSPRMHREGPKAAHRCGDTAATLKKYGQAKCMIEQDWTPERWLLEFGKNWLDEDELAHVFEWQERFEAGGMYCSLDDAAEALTGGAAEYLARSGAEPRAGFRVTLEVLPY